MEEMSLFKAVFNGVGLLALFSEVMLFTLVRDRCNWCVPMTSQLRPIAWVVVLDAAILTVGMAVGYFSTSLSAALLVSTAIMGYWTYRWEKSITDKRGSFIK